MKTKLVDLEERDRYLKVNVDFRSSREFSSGAYEVARFSEMSSSVMEHCIEKGWLEKTSRQRDSPTAQEFLEFLQENPGFHAHGYVVHPEAGHTRIIIEGLHARAGSRRPTLEQLDRFSALCRWATEFGLNPPYAWWD